VSFWDAISRLSDLLTAFEFIKRAYRWLIPRLRPTIRRIWSRNSTTILDWSFIVLVTGSNIVAQLGSVHTFVLVTISVVFIPPPVYLTLRLLRNPVEWTKSIRIFAFAPVFTVVYYVAVAIALCTAIVIINASPENIQAYRSLPEQITNIFPTLFYQALALSLFVPFLWYTTSHDLLPATKPSQEYIDAVRRLTRQ
jgi:hypothetical protein